MLNDILDIFLEVAAGVFVDVTAFAGIAILLFSYFDFRNDGLLIKTIQNNKKYQPLVGALLGLTPGCGGAILIAPLYVKKTVTFGTVVATLIATMGDASFLLMTQDPVIFVLINTITFAVGVTSGYLIDYFQIERRFDLNKKKFNGASANKTILKNNICNSIATKAGVQFEHIGHISGDKVDLVLHHQAKGHQAIGTLGFKITHKLYLLYFGILLLGLMVGIANLSSVDFGNGDFARVISGIGVVGTGASIFLMFAGHKYFSEHNHEEEEMKLASLKETFIHAIEDIAFIGTWIFIALFLYEMSMYFMDSVDYFAGDGIGRHLSNSSTYYAIVIGAVVGMIPGCGPQIIFVSLYLKGLLPIEALIAHSISQDGDALLPLIAMDIKSSLVLTVITTIIAIVIGFALLMIT